jgi:hypothetical protein
MKRGKQEDLLCNDAVENSVCVQCPEKKKDKFLGEIANATRLGDKSA